MEGRRKPIHDSHLEYNNYNMSIDSIHEYLYFDPDWNI
jgi:hypothetical protein